MRDTARRFAEDIVAPHVMAMDAAEQMHADVIQGCFDHGFMGVNVQEEYGGSDASFFSAVLVIQELAKVDPAVSVMVDVHTTIVNNLIRQHASEEIQAEWLPKLATEMIGSFCLSEEGSGSDAFALKATAVEDGGDFVLNGTKMWITSAAESGLFLVMANANPDAGYRGITCFAVPRDTPGLSIGPKEEKLGIRASSTCPVVLEDVRVPRSSVVGKIGDGYKYAIGMLNEGRVGIGAQMLGLAEGVLASTLPYVYERKQFGTRIGDFQGMQHQIARASMDIEAARMLVYNAARRCEAGLSVETEGAYAKLYASEVAERTASSCINWLGGVGFTRSFAAEKMYRDCKVGQIYEGTSNVQLNTIAKGIRREYI